MHDRVWNRKPRSKRPESRYEPKYITPTREGNKAFPIYDILINPKDEKSENSKSDNVIFSEDISLQNSVNGTIDFRLNENHNNIDKDDFDELSNSNEQKSFQKILKY